METKIPFSWSKFDKSANKDIENSKKNNETTHRKAYFLNFISILSGMY